jgi:peroxiredoxin
MEGCGYRDLQAEFDKLGVRLVGVGFSPPEAMASWAEKQEYLYEIWSDTDRTLAMHYGAADRADARTARRVTKVLDAEGKLALEYKVGLNVATHPKDVLADCRALFGTE